MARNRTAFAIGLAALGGAGPVLAQAAPGLSWIEAAGFYHHVTRDFGDWKGGGARAVIAGRRDTWYAEAKAQEAFRDSGVYGSLVNVHSFSTRVYTQIGVGAGSGRFVLPDLRLDAALTLKLGAARRLLVTAGGSFVDAKLGYRDKALLGALTWYAASTLLLEGNARINWSDPGAVRSERVSGSLTLGRTGRALLIIRGGAGTEGYQLIAPSVTLRKFRSQEASLSLRHWLGGSLGVLAGAEWYHNPFYLRAGGMLGLFHAW